MGLPEFENLGSIVLRLRHSLSPPLSRPSPLSLPWPKVWPLLSGFEEQTREFSWLAMTKARAEAEAVAETEQTL